MRHYIVCILSAFLLFFPLKSYCEITGTSQETSTNPDIVKIYGKDVDISVNSSVSAGTVALPSEYANLPDRYRSSADLENPDSMQHAIDAYRQDQITDKLPLVIINTTIALLLAYYIGNKRQIGFGWSLFFFLFAPILFGLIVVLSSRQKGEQPPPFSKTIYIIGWILILFFSMTGLVNLYLLMRDGVNVYRFLGLSGAIWSVGLGYYLAQRGKSIDLNNWVSKKNSTENVFSTKQPSYKEVLEDQFTGKKNKLYKLKLDGFLTEDEYNDKINLLDTQERVDNEHKNALNRAEEINKRAKPILDKFDSLLKDGVFTQNEYDQKWAELYDRIAIEVDSELNISNITPNELFAQPNETTSKKSDNNWDITILSFSIIASFIAIIYVYIEYAHKPISSPAEAPAAEPSPYAPTPEPPPYAPEAPIKPSSQEPSSQEPPPLEPSLSIGEHYQGGVIAFLDNTGNHGLIAAPENLNIHGFEDLMSVEQAKKECAGLSINERNNTYSNWRLPTKGELNILYLNKKTIGGFNINPFNTPYVSLDIQKINTKDDLSIKNSETISTQDFSNGYQHSNIDSSVHGIVRPVRSF
ncbi:MAG: hypothetical protein HKK67_09220 [Chlorobiaceae bacterium]|nr:hypothetical protein [Chlorobiaceae bacterium]